jgi:transposase
VFDGTKEYEVPNERGLKTLKKLLKKNYGKEWIETKPIYEPTGPYSNYLREFATENELKVYEVNPKRSANFAKALGNRSKTDSIDAKMLYKFHLLLKEEDLNIPVIDKTIEELGAFIGSYRIIQKTRTMLSNHLHAMDYKSGVDTKLKESIKEEMDHLKQIEEDLERKMKTFIEDNPETREDLRNLLSIKGIDLTSAIVLLYLFKKYPEANRNEITALAGLDPIKKQSGYSLNGERKRIH